ncbi:MAG TPA: hypothetical protein PKC25_03020, partial [Candidatus Rifleibacterium sp.]|nr:hypothetical protein [Candidatus Rifleibacterium sp.]
AALAAAGLAAGAGLPEDCWAESWPASIAAARRPIGRYFFNICQLPYKSYNWQGAIYRLSLRFATTSPLPENYRQSARKWSIFAVSVGRRTLYRHFRQWHISCPEQGSVLTFCKEGGPCCEK